MNPYEVLGVHRDAGEVEIKRAYRTLSKRHHPDYGGEQEDFERITIARDVLLNPVRRKRFDETGEVADLPIDQTRTKAIGKLSDLIAQALLHDNDPFASDLVDAMRQALKTELKNIAQHAAPVERAQQRLAKMVGRFRKDGEGDNVLEDNLAFHTERINEVLARVEADRKVLQMALDLIADVKYVYEIPRPIYPVAAWGSGGGGQSSLGQRFP